MANKLLKSFIILATLVISFSNIPFNALNFLIDSYEKTGGIADKTWLIEQNRGGVVDNFISLRKLSDKLRIREARASTFVAVSNYNSASSVSALVNKPAGTADNDIMFALIMRNNNGAVSSVPAGWSLIANHQYSTTYHQMLYWKLATGEGASYVWGFSSAGKTAITIASYRGEFDTSDPIDVVSNTEFVTTPNTTVRAASMNVSSPNSSLFWFGTIYSTAVRTWTKPAIPTTNWVENYDGGATSSDFSRTIDSMVWTGSGATGNMDGTVTTGGTTVKHAFAVALRPIPSANPDATSFINNIEGALADGGRSSQQIIISGTNLGIVSAGSRTNCAGGVGTGCIRFIVGGNATVADADVTVWSNTSITFAVNANLASYGGLASLQVVSAGVSDITPLDFYIYPNIASTSANSGQIGSEITVFGDHFGASAGLTAVNTKNASVIGAWSETVLTVSVPGQESAANIDGKIQLTRSDARTSNQYPSAGNFTILAPSASGSNPAMATAGQTLTIEFSGLGIDTDIGTAPVLKLTKTGQTDIIGASYMKIADYQTASASFNLTGAATGWWKLAIVNMDGQSGSFGDESAFGFYISAPSPTVTGINPVFGLDTGVNNIISISGANFQSGAAVKLTKTAQADIIPSTAFIYTDPSTLSGGAFDLTGKTNGWWNVVVTNPDLQSASYGNEIDSGFEIRSAKPSAPANIYQFKTNTDSAQPPTTNIAVGGGIGGQTAIYFRTDMAGGVTGTLYYPQVEVKSVGAAFECTNASPSPCSVTGGFFAEGNGIVFNGTAVQGWVNIDGVDGALYHWQIRIRSSGGTSDWASFGENTDPNDIDVYIDNTAPIISPGTDGTCSTAATNITDLGAIIKWNTSDLTSGAQNPPGSGAYATAQVQYTKTSQFTDWTTTPGSLSTINPYENSPHQITIDKLSPSAGYTYRMRSKDAAGNEALSTNCAFTTTSTRPIKTVEFFIDQETAQNTGTQIAKDFSVYIPESPGAEISVKSAFIEITGISGDTASQTINVELRRGLGQPYVPSGADYLIDSMGTTTPFTILFDALNPPGTGQETMANIATGATNYDYTLFLNGNGAAVSAFSAKLIITYSYVL